MSQREQQYESFGNVDEVVELKAIWQGLQRRIGVFSLVAVVTFLSIAIYAAVAQRFFTAETTMVIESQQRSVIDSNDVLSAPDSVPREIDTEVELLRSRAMAVRVIRRLQSQIGIEVFGDAAAAAVKAPTAEDGFQIERLSQVAENLSNNTGAARSGSAEAQDAQPSDSGESADDEYAIERAVEPQSAQPEEFESLADSALAGEARSGDASVVPTETINQVMSRLQVDRVGSTALIRIRYSSPSPQNAAFITNAFADEYILEQLEAQFRALRQASRWIDARLQDLRDEVRNSEEAAAKFRAEFGLVDSQGMNVTEQRLSQLTDDLSRARSELSSAISRYQSVNSTLQRGEPVEAISEVMESGVIRELRRQEADVNRRRGELRARYGELHPEIKQINQELQDLELQIDVEIARIVQNLKREVDFAEARVSRLSADFAALQTEIATENPALVRLRELERDTLASRGLYEALLERQKELNERERLAQADARIITRATPPDSPSRPQTRLLLAAGGVLALLFASIAAFAAEATESRIISSSDLRRSFGSALPIVLIPKIQRSKVFGERELSEIADHFIRDKPSSTFADSFREIRMHLMLAKNADGKQTPVSTAFTSSFSNEGATTTAFCFATLLATEGERVVFVDANSWRGRDDTQFSDRKFLAFQNPFRMLSDMRKKKNREDASEWDERVSVPEDGVKYFEESEIDDAGDGDDDAQAATSAKIVCEPAPHRQAQPPGARDFTLFKTVNDVDIILLSENNAVQTEPADIASIDSLLDRLSGLYDYIIIDTPAVLETAEASYFASRADYTVLLAEWRSTKRDAITTACRSLIDAHANFLGFVINKVDERRRYFFRPEDRKFYFRKR